MAIIDTDHSLPGQHGDRSKQHINANETLGRSAYTYLFPELANDEMAGIFPGTSTAETLERLRAFEAIYRVPEFATQGMKLPAVYTYFGQFINHDISAPVGGLLLEAASIPSTSVITVSDPPGLEKAVRAPSISPILQRIRNEQANPLMLDSLYGEGPRSDDPEVLSLYDNDGMKFRLATTARVELAILSTISKTPRKFVQKTGSPDIPRNGEKQLALMADRRNDENLIVSQLHLALMLLHNKTVDCLASKIADPAKRFPAARELLTRHYHWLILNDYLPHLLSGSAVARLKRGDSRLRTASLVPMEFTTAAFRFGHSMVSQSYDFNENFGNGDRNSSLATLPDLFAFTSRGGMGGISPNGQLPDHWVADWDRLTKTSENNGRGADSIDMNFAQNMLNNMPTAEHMEHGSIFYRNLLRGFHRRIPFGQQLAYACGIDPLKATDLLSAVPKEGDGKTTVQTAFKNLGFASHTPAWLYFLLEAQILEQGQRLGPTASQIISDTIVGLLKNNPSSYLSGAGAPWHPQMSDLKDQDGQPLDSIRKTVMFAVTKP